MTGNWRTVFSLIAGPEQVMGRENGLGSVDGEEFRSGDSPKPVTDAVRES